MSDIDAILGFWTEPKPTTEEEVAERGKLWFGGGPDLDAKIRERFGALVEQAARWSSRRGAGRSTAGRRSRAGDSR
jgi:uncharacterized protein (DUF924 family)